MIREMDFFVFLGDDLWLPPGGVTYLVSTAEFGLFVLFMHETVRCSSSSFLFFLFLLFPLQPEIARYTYLRPDFLSVG